jgi:Tol biopolymer transport system component
MRNLLHRCLDRNLRQRLPHIGEARIVIEGILSGSGAAAEPVVAASNKTRQRLAWSLAAGFCIAFLAAAVWGAFAYFRPAAQQAEALRFLVSPPESSNLRQVTGPAGALPAPLVVSPDGRRVAFVARTADGKIQIWVRSLDSLNAQALAGTEDAVSPFWSPDSRFLGFFAGGKLKKIDVSGGPPLTLCDAQDGWGATWNRDGIIVFASGSGLQKVAAAGGVPAAATTLAQDEIRHYRPFFLPDGRHFLYSVTGGNVFVASLDSPERKMLLKSDSFNVLYSQGHLLYLRETTLMAQPFDLQRLEFTGDPFPIAEEIRIGGMNPGTGLFSVSENGVLTYQTGTGAGFETKLVWFDRTGKQIGALGDPANYSDVYISPDGKQASVSILDPVRRTRDIWIYDLARSLKTRFTFEPGDEYTLIWSPDGKRAILTSRRKQYMDLYQRLADNSGTEETLLEDNTDKYYLSLSPDGRSLLYGTGNTTPQTGNDLWLLPLLGDPSTGSGQGRKPVPFLKTQFSERFGQFSPDGRWVLYDSNESGRYEVYVAPYPGPGGKRQVSTAGGFWPRWRRDGTEIFYRSLDGKLMEAAVNGKSTGFEVGVVKPLFEARFGGTARSQYDVSPDGQRFLINTMSGQAGEAPITVVVNWTAGLNK